MADIDKLKKDACVVRDEQKDSANTAYRIGSVLLQIIDSVEYFCSVVISSNSNNRFDKKEATPNSYIDVQGNLIGDFPLAFVTHLIPVKKGDVIYCPYASQTGSATGAFYRSDKSLLCSASDHWTRMDDISKFVAPAEAAFVRLNGNTIALDNYMVVINMDYPVIYEPFEDALLLSPDIRIEPLERLEKETQAHSGRIEELEGRDIPSSEKNDGYMTKDQAKKLNSIVSGKHSNNRFDKSKRTASSYIDINGGLNGGLSVAFVTDMIAVQPGDVIYCPYASQTGSATGAFYRSDKNLLCSASDHWTRMDDISKFVAPEGAAFVRLNGNTIALDNYMVVVNMDYPAAYEPFEDALFLSPDIRIEPLERLEKETQAHSGRIEELEGRDIPSSEKNDGYMTKEQAKRLNSIVTVKHSNNRFDKSKRTASSYIDVHGGLNGGLPEAFVTDMIAVQSGDVIYCPYASQTGSATGAFYRSDKSLLCSASDHWTRMDDISKFVAPAEAAFVRLNGNTIALDNYMVVINMEYPAAYEPYNDKAVLSPDIHIEAEDSLEGKKIAGTGDSICESPMTNGGYLRMLSEKYKMGYQNLGVSGGTITANVGDRFAICRSVAQLDPNADYILLEGGVNDASVNAPMGKITEDMTSPLDDTTYCGALESMCKTAVTKFAGKKIGFLIVHKMTIRYDAGYCHRSIYNQRDDFYYHTVQILRKWGIPFLDLNVLCPPLCYIKELRDKYTCPLPEGGGDGWHPNKEGYEKFYIPKIESWLKNL